MPSTFSTSVPREGHISSYQGVGGGAIRLIGAYCASKHKHRQSSLSKRENLEIFRE